jgi:pyruvyl transferase EpsO
MATLRAKALAVGDLIPEHSAVWLVGYPIYPNFGDVLILLGTIEMLRTRSSRIVEATSSDGGRFRSHRVTPQTVCVLQGGGNFGDLWPEHQVLREGVITLNRHCRIVGMPQSLHFDDARGLDRFASIASHHPDLHLFWRDHRSYETARARFPCHNYLAPDMAQTLWPIYRQPAPAADGGRIFIFRTDQETAANPASVTAMSNHLDDWWDFHSERWKTMLRFCHGMDRRLGAAGIARQILDLWVGVSRAEARYLAGVFGRQSEIVTNRLHGHIFACLTERRSRVVDNVYGKTSAYFDAWTGALGLGAMESRFAA